MLQNIKKQEHVKRETEEIPNLPSEELGTIELSKDVSTVAALQGLLKTDETGTELFTDAPLNEESVL